jgi:hypothetical protein
MKFWYTISSSGSLANFGNILMNFSKLIRHSETLLVHDKPYEQEFMVFFIETAKAVRNFVIRGPSSADE